MGIGETGTGKTGKTTLQLCAESAKLAIEDAGLKLSDIDGLLTAYPWEEPYLMHSNVLAEYLGITTDYTATLAVGGASPAVMVGHAAACIAEGVCDTVVAVMASNRASGLGRDKAIQMLAQVGHPQFEDPYGPTIPSLYALVAQSHMHEFGTTPEQLAAIAVSQRNFASKKEGAVMRTPITIADVLNAKMVATPLHMLDCCLVSDFGGAVVVTSAERAKSLRKQPVYVLGVGEGHTHEHITWAPSLTSFGCKISGERAFKMAGLTPKDVDVAELYDCFTITALIELEDLGFCGKGEGGPFVESGRRIGLGGNLPMNTNGGMLSFATGGIFHITEAVSQLRGEAGERQVKDAKVAVAHGNGGILSAHATLVLGTERI